MKKIVLLTLCTVFVICLSEPKETHKRNTANSEQCAIDEQSTQPKLELLDSGEAKHKPNMIRLSETKDKQKQKKCGSSRRQLDKQQNTELFETQQSNTDMATLKQEELKRQMDRLMAKRSKGFEKSLILTANGKYYNLTNPTPLGEFECGAKSKVRSRYVTLHDTGPTRNGYQIVDKEMSLTNKGPLKFHIVKIEKVVNPCIWRRYRHYKSEVIREVRKANEMLLFHGSVDPRAVAEHGFDERYASNGGTFGPGIYFADHSSKSDNYAIAQDDGTKMLLLCRVILGKVYNETSEKFRHQHPPMGYNSVRGGKSDVEYVVYRGEQAYPEYLITYRTETV